MSNTELPEKTRKKLRELCKIAYTRELNHPIHELAAGKLSALFDQNARRDFIC